MLMFECVRVKLGLLDPRGASSPVNLSQLGNYKEKKLGAKHNLKKEEELKNQGNFKAGYRCPATWYRYPRRKPTPNHVQAWTRRDPRPNPRWTAFRPRLGVGFHHSPRLGVAKEAQTTPEPSCSVLQTPTEPHDRAIFTVGREPNAVQAQHHAKLKSQLGLGVVQSDTPRPKCDSLPSSPTLQFVSISDSINLRGNDTLLTLYYLIRSGALAGGSLRFRKDFGHHSFNTSNNLSSSGLGSLLEMITGIVVPSPR
ncbi:hypothetical protein PIB30_036657 [Stylosanthes scabra]|uniref:Uncharacterized protein n=1 Tax=Stylosanthes scabra TaxID=79078 RepID=A0ABU6VC13_9FABA|nr:hypothetical protein [Stylosanthes scabra]